MTVLQAQIQGEAIHDGSVMANQTGIVRPGFDADGFRVPIVGRLKVVLVDQPLPLTGGYCPGFMNGRTEEGVIRQSGFPGQRQRLDLGKRPDQTTGTDGRLKQITDRPPEVVALLLESDATRPAANIDAENAVPLQFINHPPGAHGGILKPLGQGLGRLAIEVLTK